MIVLININKSSEIPVFPFNFDEGDVARAALRRFDRMKGWLLILLKAEAALTRVNY
jgi:hypothetical protein